MRIITYLCHVHMHIYIYIYIYIIRIIIYVYTQIIVKLTNMRDKLTVMRTLLGYISNNQWYVFQRIWLIYTLCMHIQHTRHCLYMYSIYMYSYAIIFVIHSEFLSSNIKAPWIIPDLVLDPSIGNPPNGRWYWDIAAPKQMPKSQTSENDGDRRL